LKIMHVSFIFIIEIVFRKITQKSYYSVTVYRPQS